MRIAFMSWRDLANEQAGGSEVFIDRLAGSRSWTWVTRSLISAAVQSALSLIPYSTWEALPRNMRGLRSCTIGWPEIGTSWSTRKMDSPTSRHPWRRNPILACVYHVHSEQWSQRFPPPLAAAGRFAEAKIMPLVYRRVPFMAISSSTASALEALESAEKNSRAPKRG